MGSRELLWALGELNESPAAPSLRAQPVTSQKPVTAAFQPVTAVLPGFELVTGQGAPVTGFQDVTGCGTTEPPKISPIEFVADNPYPRPGYVVVTLLSELEHHLSVLLERPLVAIDIE